MCQNLLILNSEQIMEVEMLTQQSQVLELLQFIRVLRVQTD
jgi:hypothetical protein